MNGSRPIAKLNANRHGGIGVSREKALGGSEVWAPLTKAGRGLAGRTGTRQNMPAGRSELPTGPRRRPHCAGMGGLSPGGRSSGEEQW